MVPRAPRRWAIAMAGASLVGGLVALGEAIWLLWILAPNATQGRDVWGRMGLQLAAGAGLLLASAWLAWRGRAAVDRRLALAAGLTGAGGLLAVWPVLWWLFRLARDAASAGAFPGLAGNLLWETGTVVWLGLVPALPVLLAGVVATLAWRRLRAAEPEWRPARPVIWFWTASLPAASAVLLLSGFGWCVAFALFPFDARATWSGNASDWVWVLRDSHGSGGKMEEALIAAGDEAVDPLLAEIAHERTRSFRLYRPHARWLKHFLGRARTLDDEFDWLAMRRPITADAAKILGAIGVPARRALPALQAVADDAAAVPEERAAAAGAVVAIRRATAMRARPR